MLETLSSILSGLKQTTPAILLGIGLASGFGVLASDAVMGRLGLLDLRSQYRPQLGVALVLASSLLGAQSVLALSRSVFERQAKRRRAARKIKQCQTSLRSLTPDEKAYLLPFIVDKENTLYLHIEDGVAGGLVAQDILFRSSNVGDMLRGFAHNMQPWAREYLERNKHLLEGANPKPKPWSRW